MITRVRNKTAQPIVSLGLTSNETKLVFYSKPFWINEQAIRSALASDQIEFLDDYGNVVVSANNKYPQGFTETADFNKLCILFNSDWSKLTEEDKEDILEEIGDSVIQFIRSAFRRANIQGYTRANLFTALGNIPSMLRFGDITAASAAISAITTDAFFTANRKTRLKAILDSVDLN